MALFVGAWLTLFARMAPHPLESVAAVSPKSRSEDGL